MSRELDNAQYRGGTARALAALFFAAIILLSALLSTACRASGSTDSPAVSNGGSALAAPDTEDKDPSAADRAKPKVRCSIYPLYCFARAVGGGDIDLELLVPPGADLHSYEPDSRTMAGLAKADLVFYVGGDSDVWAEKLLDASSDGSHTRRLVKLIERVSPLPELESPGMEGLEDEHEHAHGQEAVGDEAHEHAHEEEAAGDEAHAHDHDHESDACCEAQEHGHEHDAELDEHIWTSPKRVLKIVQKMAEELSAIDPAHRTQYEKNAAAYSEKIRHLDQQISEIVRNGKRDILIFGDRFPLRYLTHDYGLRFDAAFPGCSSEIEPSVAGMKNLAERIRSEQIPVIFYLEFSNRRVAETLRESTGCRIMEYNSAHNVDAAQFKSGLDYVDIMESNLEALREALN